MIKKTIKIFVIGLLSILTLIIISYFVFIANAEKIVKEIVTYYTKGTMRIEMKKLKFNPRELRITIEKAEISTVDSIHQNSTYNIKVDTMILELASIRPLLLNRKLKIDSITFKRPSISVVQWKEQKKEKFSLAQQMDKVYTSLNHTLDKLSIKYCLLDSGAFSIEDKVHPERKKVTVTDFYFLIDNLHKTSSLNKDDRFFFSDRIKFYSSHQHIKLAGGNQEIGYSRLRINSGRRIVELDSCYMYSKKNNIDFNSFSGYFDTLRFTGVDFKRLTQENVLDADSAYCYNPKVLLKTTIKKSGKSKTAAQVMTKDSFAVVMKYLLGNFNLNYIGVDNAAIEIQTKSGDKVSTYNIKRTDFSMHDVAVIDHPDSAIKVGIFDLGLVGYKAYDPDSNYQVKFDSIRFMNDRIFLSNFTIIPSKKLMADDFKDIRMASLAINQLSWIDLLVNRKVVAAEIELIEPQLRLVLPERNEPKQDKKNFHFLSAIKNIAKYADVEKLGIQHALLKINRGDLLVDLKGLNCSIPVNRLLKSENLNDFLSASLLISFESGKIAVNQNEIIFNNGRFDGKNKTLFLKETLVGNSKNKLNGYFQNLMLINPVESSSGHFDLSSLSWDKANLSLTLDKKNTQKGRQKPVISIKDCKGFNTKMQIHSGEMSAGGNLSVIMAKDFVYDESEKVTFSDLSFKGFSMSMSKKSSDMVLSQVDFKNNQPSLLNGLILRSAEGKYNIDLNFTTVEFSVDLNKVLRNDFDFEYLNFLTPVLRLSKNDSIDVFKKSMKSIDFPAVRIGKLSITEPEIHTWGIKNPLLPRNEMLNASFFFSGVNMQHSHINFSKGFMSLADMSISTPKLNLLLPTEDSLKLSVHDFSFDLGSENQKKEWSVFADTIQTGGLKFELKKDNEKNKVWQIEKTLLTSLHISNDNVRNPEMLLSDNPNFKAQLKKIGNSDGNQSLSFSELNFSNDAGLLSIDDFSFKPNAEKEAFVAMNDYQKDFPVFSAEKIAFKGFSPRSYIKDSVLKVDKIELHHPDLYIYKDKRKPFKKGIYKHLPSSLLNQLKMKFEIDTVGVSDGNITYEELNEKTNRSGRVLFSQLHAIITNVKNYNHEEKDSLHLNVAGKFMDSASIKFRFSESYTDSLHAFTYGLRLRSFDLKILNPILEPLVSARILSGALDTLRVNAIGREHMSHGKMKMYYNDLKIQYLNKGSDSVKNLKSRLINFVANDLLLKRNNKKGMGIVYAERDKERGFANYWLKIGLSGVISSSGVKKNKKVERIYRKKLKKLKIPEIPDVDL